MDEEHDDLYDSPDFNKFGIGFSIMPTPYATTSGMGLFWRANENISVKLFGGSYGGNFDFAKGYIVAEARYFLIWGFYTDFGVGTWTNRAGYESDEDEDFRNYGPMLELGWSAFEDENWSLGLSLLAASYSVNGVGKPYYFVNGLEIVYYFYN